MRVYDAHFTMSRLPVAFPQMRSKRQIYDAFDNLSLGLSFLGLRARASHFLTTTRWLRGFDMPSFVMMIDYAIRYTPISDIAHAQHWRYF